MNLLTLGGDSVYSSASRWFSAVAIFRQGVV